MGYAESAWERAMTVHEVVVRALSGEIHWFRAADIPRSLAPPERSAPRLQQARYLSQLVRVESRRRGPQKLIEIRTRRTRGLAI